MFKLDRIPDQRDRCTACMMSRYRDTSVLMHAGVSISDAANAIGVGRFDKAARSVFKNSVAVSLLSVAQQAGKIRRLAGVRGAQQKHSGKQLLQ